MYIKYGRGVVVFQGYVSTLGYLYKSWDLEAVKQRELNYTVTTHQAIPYTSNGKDVQL